MMWVYYAVVKGDAMLLITINAAGSVIETTYIALFVIYAPRQARVRKDCIDLQSLLVIFMSPLPVSLLMSDVGIGII